MKYRIMRDNNNHIYYVQGFIWYFPFWIDIKYKSYSGLYERHEFNFKEEIKRKIKGWQTNSLSLKPDTMVEVIE